MVGPIIYLDIDDEITSAAARVRAADAHRVAVVLPYGSRVATSRINFRLLARDSLTHDKRLSVIAGDAATRALAASAGLPVFASVGEYEEAFADAGDDEAGPAAPVRPVTRAAPAPSPAAPPPARPARAPAPVVPVAPEAPAAPSGGPKPAEVAAPQRPVERPSPRSSPSPRDHGSDADPRTAMDAALAGDTVRVPTDRRSNGSRSVLPGDGRRFPPVPVVVGIVALAVVLVVGSVLAYVVLPSATITVTPRRDPIDLPRFTVVADPGTTSPDAVRGVVPAVRIPIEVDVNDTFPASGERVEEAKAVGTVTFQSFNPVSTNTIPNGSIVSTEGGIEFRTVRTLTIPRAKLILGTPVIVESSAASVDVEAVKAGTAGNVPPNSIIVVPRGEDPTFTKVRNRDATTGGTHEVFARVSQADVDGALAALRAAVEADFQARLDDPSLAPDGTTVFRATASLGAATPTVDPASLVGQEIASFELGLVASGSVLAVDAAPVRTIAETRLAGAVRPNHELIEGSMAIEVGEAEVSDGRVAFPVRASAAQAAILDPDVLRDAVLGLALDDARVVLAAYGTVDVSLWPGWVNSVPTIADRVQVSVRPPIAVGSPAPGATP